LTNLGSEVGFSCKRRTKKGAKTSRGVAILERECLVLCILSKANVGDSPNTLLRLKARGGNAQGREPQALKRQARNDDARRAETERDANH
jgi:hypothetical protein